MSQVVVTERMHANRMARMQAIPIWLIGPVYIVAYVALAWLSIVASTPSFGIVPWSPETGLTFAVFLVFGRQFWPYLLLAAAASNLILHSELPPLVQVLSPIIIGGGYAMALNWIQQSRWQFDIKLASLRDILALEAIAIVSAVLVASASVMLLSASSILTTAEIPYNIFRYAIGDLIGISIIAPFLLILANTGGIPKPTLEAGIQGLAILAALGLAFGFSSLRLTGSLRLRWASSSRCSFQDRSLPA